MRLAVQYFEIMPEIDVCKAHAGRKAIGIKFARAVSYGRTGTRPVVAGLLVYKDQGIAMGLHSEHRQSPDKAT